MKAEVIRLEQFSGHAGQDEILRWLGGMPEAPRRTFLVHGEPAAAETLQGEIRSRMGWEVEVAAYRQRVRLEA